MDWYMSAGFFSWVECILMGSQIQIQTIIKWPGQTQCSQGRNWISNHLLDRRNWLGYWLLHHFCNNKAKQIDRDHNNEVRRLCGVFVALFWRFCGAFVALLWRFCGTFVALWSKTVLQQVPTSDCWELNPSPKASSFMHYHSLINREKTKEFSEEFQPTIS